MYKLYIFVRSDLESMNAGRLGAQCAHAASMAAELSNNIAYKKWAGNSCFGTTIVLDGGSFEEDECLNVDYSFDCGFFFKDNLKFYMVRDTSYPLRDGKVTHLLDINTCYWHFGDPDTYEDLKKYLEKFKLYNGNHD